MDQYEENDQAKRKFIHGLSSTAGIYIDFPPLSLSWPPSLCWYLACLKQEVVRRCNAQRWTMQQSLRHSHWGQFELLPRFQDKCALLYILNLTNNNMSVIVFCLKYDYRILLNWRKIVLNEVVKKVCVFNCLVGSVVFLCVTAVILECLIFWKTFQFAPFIKSSIHSILVVEKYG